MNSFASKLVPVAIACILCGIALAGGGKDHYMKMMDADDDGKVSAAEHDRAAAKMFTTMDSNNDGRVTIDEMDAAGPMMKHHRAQREQADGGQMHSGKTMSSSTRIAKLDTNGDGQLSAEEHAMGARDRFNNMDTNNDGSLTAQELREGHRSMMSASE